MKEVYADKTFCPFWLLCNDSSTCADAYTPELQQDAQSSGLPVSLMQDIPTCFIVIWDDETLPGTDTVDMVHAE